MLVKGVVRSGLDKARRYIVIIAFSAGAVVVYLPTLASIGIGSGF